jgi:K+/H+ antiporter YhaU regulatory subunit KhtT
MVSYDELKGIVEKDNLEFIRQAQEDIALLITVRERFPNETELQERIKALISLERQEIETLSGEIRNGRTGKAERV